MDEGLKKKDITVFTIGANENKLLDLAKRHGIKSQANGNLKTAVENISKVFTKEDQVALLSPAAASFDQFKSYADRGKQFKELVAKL